LASYFIENVLSLKPCQEDYEMRVTHRFIGSLILAAAIVAPVATIAAPAPQAVSVKVYDRSHKDYHNWDDHENTAWGLYLTDNHQKHYEYAHASKKQQDHYWTWRHSHPD
jgi:hypothetical protein